MTCATERDGDVADPREDAFEARNAFERLYSRWLAARAALADPDHARGKAVGPDEDISRLLKECDQAARDFLFTPAPLAWMIWWKFEALELYWDEERRDGERPDGLPLHALVSIKSDLQRLGLDSLGGAQSMTPPEGVAPEVEL